MANRHLSRSIVLQTLFEWDFNGKKDDVAPILTRNSERFAPGVDDMPFMETLLQGVLQKQSVIDEIIEKAAPEWPLDKISNTDRNVLRIGLFELLFGNREEVPPKVAINEAIELAKSFGGDNSGRFVNGVLGAVYKEIGEPGKEQESKKKKVEEVDPATLPIEVRAGAVVFARHEGILYFALVHDVFGYWTLVKGSVNEGEETQAGMIRRVKEKIGIEVTPLLLLGQNEYIASHPEKGKHRKQVSFFLAEAAYQPLTLESSGGLDDAQWFPLPALAGIRTYDDIVPLLEKSITYITEQQ